MDPWSDLGDAELVKRIRAGERGAWTTLTRRHSNRLWAVARGLRLGDADAADAVQTTWLRLVQHLDRLREPEYVDLAGHHDATRVPQRLAAPRPGGGHRVVGRCPRPAGPAGQSPSAR